jgi:hypothetical protein
MTMELSFAVSFPKRLTCVSNQSKSTCSHSRSLSVQRLPLISCNGSAAGHLACGRRWERDAFPSDTKCLVAA